MRISTIRLIATTFCFTGTFCIAFADPERVVRMQESRHLLSQEECSNHKNSQYWTGAVACNAPSLGNEAWEINPNPSASIYMFASPEQLKDKYTFTVYTTKDVDDKISKLEKSISDLRDSVTENSKKLDDAELTIMLRIDKMPAELPTNAGFYEQLRERLKADIAADLDKAKSDIVPPAQ